VFARFTAGTIVLVGLLAGPVAASAKADPPAPKSAQEIVGIWLGAIEAGGERLRVVIKISTDDAGDLVARAFRAGEPVIEAEPDAAAQGAWYMPP